MMVQQFIGIAFLSLGLVSMSSYSESLSGMRLSWFYNELKPMKERWGETTGTILHILEYVVAPIGFGVLFLMGLVVFR
ncbi:MAG TPA: hypothetical protein VF498_00605 [Anaerolineales bacterium]